MDRNILQDDTICSEVVHLNCLTVAIRQASLHEESIAGVSCVRIAVIDTGGFQVGELLGCAALSIFIADVQLDP